LLHGGYQNDHGRDVDPPTEESHKGRGLATPAAFGAAAKAWATPKAVLKGRRQTPRLAPVVGSIQRTVAMRTGLTACGSDRICVNFKDELEKSRICKELMRHRYRPMVLLKGEGTSSTSKNQARWWGFIYRHQQLWREWRALASGIVAGLNKAGA
jgi:hypothetical protein